MTDILDEATYERVRRALAHATEYGYDWTETLHEEGLLLSPAIKRRIQLETLTAFREQFREFRPAQYLRRVRVETATPTDMHTGIAGFLDDYIAALLKEGQ